jgi:large subunit ribosomal protein L19e
MDLGTQKRVAAAIMKCSQSKVYFDPEHLEEIKEAITKQDLRELINANIIQRKPDAGVSRGRARKVLAQKKKGRQKGQGSRKGKATARVSKKEKWMAKVRAQRKFLKVLKEKKHVNNEEFKTLYGRSKGGFFRNIRHIKFFMKDKKIGSENGKEKT